MIVDELIAILGFDLKGEGDLNKFKDGLETAEKKASAFVAVITKLGLAAAAGFAAIGGTAAAVSFGKGFVRDITNTGREFENFGVRLKALEGSSEGAEKAMAWIRQFAIETPLELSQVVDAFANMRAFGMDPMNGSLRAIVDAMAATGGGAEKLDGIVLALGQAWTKGKLQGEEAMQLLERGVPVWELLGQATGKNAAQLQELASKGKLGRKEIQLLIDALGKKYLGASEDAAKTFDGILSNLTDNWTNWLLAISEAGYYDDLKRRMQGLLGWVNGLWEGGFADRSAKRISDFLVSAMTNASHLAMQAYRIGAGFASAAIGVNRLISSVTGLDQTMTAAGIGAAAIASSAWGRGALMAVARRIPTVAALLALDDIVSGLNGDDSLIGSTEEGRAALDRLKKSLTDLDAAATAFAANLGSVRASIVQNLGMPAEAFST
ncbi:tape measure protein [Aureimonas ureilytica]|uniref:tape measure protein n=1 Tax=Aureimonas ureilytica TaxID=401562 RepID=UPI0003720A1B|nr:tape measure protein [Aureimonas ureilytica]